MIQTAIDSLNNRFQLDSFTENLKIFDPCNFPEEQNQIADYGCQEIKFFAQFYCGQNFEVDPK